MRWALALAVLLCACGHKKRPGPTASPDPTEVSALVEKLRPEVAKWPTLMERPGSGRLDEIARAAGAPAAHAIHEILLERYSGEVHMSIRGWPERDADVDRPAWLMGELADDALKATLARTLAQRELHTEFRRQIVIALCRKGNAGAMDELVDLAIDRQEDPEVRRAILERLPRLEAKPPVRLHDALYLPSQGLDRMAAVSLARMDDPEAPSLVLDGLRGDDGFTPLGEFLPAVTRITGEEFPEPAYPVISEFDRGRRAEALRAWIARSGVQTEFERERRAYLDGPSRRRELALASFDDILAAGDDFDLASAILLATGDKDREADLERLDRLAHLARRRIDGLADPEARISALNECLLPRREAVEWGAKESGRISRLDYVLERSAGNCLGWSTLYLAVGERCGLPLRAIRSPGHMFVRYDDGTFRRNIEATDLGVARADDSYRRGEFGPVELSRRQVVADALNSAACTEAYYERYDEARDLVARALTLDPGFGMAYFNRAKYTFHSRLDADESVVADLEKALVLHPNRVACQLDAADILLPLGRTERALELYRLANGFEPSARAREGEAICLAILGRGEEARAAAGGEVTMELWIRLAPEEARTAVAAAGGSAGKCWDAAWLLLDVEPPRNAEALGFIDEGIEKLQARPGAFPDNPDWVLENRTKRNFLVLRAKALARLGRMDEARAQLEDASALRGSNRLLLKVRAYVEPR